MSYTLNSTRLYVILYNYMSFHWIIFFNARWACFFPSIFSFNHLNCSQGCGYGSDWIRVFWLDPDPFFKKIGSGSGLNIPIQNPSRIMIESNFCSGIRQKPEWSYQFSRTRWDFNHLVSPGNSSRFSSKAICWPIWGRLFLPRLVLNEGKPFWPFVVEWSWRCYGRNRHGQKWIYFFQK